VSIASPTNPNAKNAAPQNFPILADSEITIVLPVMCDEKKKMPAPNNIKLIISKLTSLTVALTLTIIFFCF